VTPAERRAALEAVGSEVRACTRCRLHAGRTSAVPGEGHADTEVVFVGEGPGMNEDRQGRPFVGRAGDLLVRFLATIGWTQNTLSVLDDCREVFDNLVELTKRHASSCCGITVGPADVGGGSRLQDLLDRLKGQRTIVSLQAGRYELNAPLTFGHEHSYLTLEGCNDGVVIAAKSGTESKFTPGLIKLERANGITLPRASR